jgi:hypothetical protein
VIVDQVNIVNVAAAEPKNNPVVPRYRDAPEALKIPLQGMKPESGKIRVAGFVGDIQHTQDALNLVGKIGPDFAVITLIQQLQAFMAPAHNHTLV